MTTIAPYCGPDLAALLRASYEAAVSAADPLRMLEQHLPRADEIAHRRRTVVVGAGKAAASMALAVERHWPAEAPLEGLVVTRYAHGLPCQHIRVIEAGHPVPDEAGEAAAEEMLALVATLGPEDLLLVLVSGGGSSLLSLPVPRVPMADLRAVTRSLLASGAPIEEMNVVRKHLSRIQGGRLAQACGAPMRVLMISDVAGDDPSAIASGPCVADPSTYGQALEILQRWNVVAPDSVRDHLERGVRGLEPETPKPGDPHFDRVDARVIATAHESLEAAAAVFRQAGIVPVVLGDTITGEARDVAQVMGAIAREIARYGQPWPPPVALISGGECTVTLRGRGQGGRCTEFLLALARNVADLPQVWAIAADTDGIDGVGEDAGALLRPDSLRRATERGLDARRLLDDNDSHRFFSELGDLITTGPTRTNVNDYRAVVLLAPTSRS